MKKIYIYVITLRVLISRLVFDEALVNVLFIGSESGNEEDSVVYFIDCNL